MERYFHSDGALFCVTFGVVGRGALCGRRIWWLRGCGRVAAQRPPTRRVPAEALQGEEVSAAAVFQLSNHDTPPK